MRLWTGPLGGVSLGPWSRPGTSLSGPVAYVYARHDVLPSIFEEGWLVGVNELIERWEVDMVIPAHDSVLLELARQHNNLGAGLVTSPMATVEITRSKSATYRALGNRLRTPKIHGEAAAVQSFPVFVKPDAGQGSQGAKRIHSALELGAALTERDDLLILEDLPGEEVTVDCFSDRESGLKFCGGRTRTRVRAGISVTSRPIEDPEFESIAHTILSVLDLHGAWFFQLKRAADGAWALLEVAPRIAGTSGLHRAMGVNLPLLSLYEHARLQVAVSPNPHVVEVDRALQSSFRLNLDYDTVYVDLDDTLIVRGQVHSQLVRFLYDCLNRGCHLVLVTRHASDPVATLERHRLGSLFDEVIHLQADSPKADHCPGPRAIFLDDSYAERRSVAQQAKIPTFDLSQLDALIDDRA